MEWRKNSEIRNTKYEIRKTKYEKRIANKNQITNHKNQTIMKNLKISMAILMTAGLFAFTIPLLAQDPGGPPPPPASHGQSGNQEGAPIGGGLFILLGMAGIYGGYKGYKVWKEKRDEEKEVVE